MGNSSENKISFHEILYAEHGNDLLSTFLCHYIYVCLVSG